MGQLLEQLHVLLLQLHHFCLSLIEQIKHVFVHKAFYVEHRLLVELVEMLATVKIFLATVVALVFAHDIHR